MFNRRLGHGTSGQGIDGRFGHGMLGRLRFGQETRESSHAMTIAAMIGMATFATPPTTWRAA